MLNVIGGAAYPMASPARHLSMDFNEIWMKSEFEAAAGGSMQASAAARARAFLML